MLSNSWQGILQTVLTILLINRYDVTHASQESYLKIPALGRSAQLGYLYDERTDQFRDVNMFKRAIPPDMISTTQIPLISIETSVADTYEDRLKLFHVGTQAGISILADFINIDGSSSYILKMKKSTLDVTGILLYRCETVVQNLQAYYDGLKPIYNTDLLHKTEATHIVTGIKWGANIAVDFVNRASNDSFKVEVAGALQLEFKLLTEIDISLRGGTKHNITWDDSDKVSGFSMSVKGDIQIPDQVPTTHGDVHKLMNQVPELIKMTNEGKGVPLEFTLMPLGPLKVHLKQETEVNNFANKLDESVLNDFIGIFDEISYCEQLLYDANDELQTNIICVLPEVRIKLIALRSEFIKAKTMFTATLKDTLINVRTGNQSQSALSDLADKYISNSYSASNTEIKLHEFRHALEKIELYKAIQNQYKNIEYFGSKNTLNARLVSNLKDVIYILFQSPKMMANDLQAWDDNSFTFFKTLNKPYNKLFVVDCDFDYPQCLLLNKTVIKQVISGRFMIHDVDAELKKTINLKPLSMKAVGRFARLGELYDARQDTFLGRTLLLSGHSELLTKSAVKQDWETIGVDTECIEDKFRALKITEESQFSILADLHPLSRSGQFLKRQEMKKYPINVKSIAHVRYFGESEIKILDPVFEESLDVSAVNSGDATHFVTKIEHGYNSIFSILDPSKTSATSVGPEVVTFVSNLKKLLDRIDIDNTTLNQVTAKDLPMTKPFHMTIYSDTQMQESKPISIDLVDQLVGFFNKTFIPRHFSQNLGIGQPLGYILYPIANLRKNYGVLGPAVEFDSVSSANLNPSDFVSLIEERELQLQFANRQIQELLKEINDFYYCTTNDDMMEIMEIKIRAAKLGGLKLQFKNIVEDIKSTKLNATWLSDFMTEHSFLNAYTKNQSYVGSSKIMLLKETLNLCKQLKRDKIEYLGRPSTNFSFNDIFTQKSVNYKNKYLLYYKPSWTQEKGAKGDVWRRTSQLFFGPLSNSNNPGWGYFVVNCEFDYPYCSATTQPTIHEYKNGKLTSTNYADAAVKEESSAQQQLNELKAILRLERESFNFTLQDNKNSIKLLSTRMETNKNIAANDDRTLITQIDANKNTAASDDRSLITRIDANKNIAANDDRSLSSRIDANKNTAANDDKNLGTAIQINKNSAIANGKDIKSLRTSVEINRVAVTKNLNSIDFLKERMCIKDYARTLSCTTGLIPIFSHGFPAYYEYKVSQFYQNSERCVWTLDNKRLVGGKYVRTDMDLKITIVCEGFVDSGDTLSVVKWHRNRLVTSAVLRKLGDSHTLGSLYDSVHLSFSSNTVNRGTGFLIKVEYVSGSDHNTGNNYFYSATSSLRYFPYTVAGDRITIVVNINKHIRFTLNSFESATQVTACSTQFYDTFFVYEIGEQGAIKNLLKLCGRRTTAITVTSNYPLLVVMETVTHQVGKLFGVSWT